MKSHAVLLSLALHARVAELPFWNRHVEICIASFHIHVVAVFLSDGTRFREHHRTQLNNANVSDRGFDAKLQSAHARHRDFVAVFVGSEVEFLLGEVGDGVPRFLFARRANSVAIAVHLRHAFDVYARDAQAVVASVNAKVGNPAVFVIPFKLQCTTHTHSRDEDQRRNQTQD